MKHCVPSHNVPVTNTRTIGFILRASAKPIRRILPILTNLREAITLRGSDSSQFSGSADKNEGTRYVSWQRRHWPCHEM